METFSLQQWISWSRSYQRLPFHCVRKSSPLPLNGDWSFAKAENLIFLDSTKSGRFSTLIPEALHRLKGFEEGMEVESLTEKTPPERQYFEGHPLEKLREWLAQNRGPVLPKHLPPGNGGLFGLLSYDLARVLEKLPAKNAPDPIFPYFTLLEARSVLVYDHFHEELHSFDWSPIPTDPKKLEPLYLQAKARAEKNFSLWPKNCEESLKNGTAATGRTPDEPQYSFSREGFEQAVRTIQEYIGSGDTYQVNLSLRRSQKLRAPEEQIYAKLRQINPSPYMGFFRQADWTLLCGSPELLLKRRGDDLETRPIAGTRPRGTRTTEEDENLGKELIAHPKEKAEHLMLVDLLRNDLGRVSRYGTVNVPEFMTLERYSHVQHIVSLVKGKIHEDCDSFDALAAIFPGGTITGAPKVRTMEIIEELEPVRRGPYTGSLGWIHTSGIDMEWNIIIRTLWTSGGQIHMQSGAGIVADSDPSREYQESLQKAKAAWAAVHEANHP